MSLLSSFPHCGFISGHGIAKALDKEALGKWILGPGSSCWHQFLGGTKAISGSRAPNPLSWGWWVVPMGCIQSFTHHTFIFSLSTGPLGPSVCQAPCLQRACVRSTGQAHRRC